MNEVEGEPAPYEAPSYAPTFVALALWFIAAMVVCFLAGFTTYYLWR